MLSRVRKAPEGLCPYCSQLVCAVLLKGQWFRRNQYLCTHTNCKKTVYICLSLSCNNYVKSEKKSSKYCHVCRAGDDYDSGDGGDGSDYSPSEQREHAGSRHKTSNDISSDNTFTDSGGDSGGGDGGGGD